MTFNNVRRVIYPIMGLLILAVFALSLYQLYLLNFAPDPSTYSGVPAQPGGLPTNDNRGAFLQLVPGSDARFPSSLVQLLETNEAGVVPAELAVIVKADTLSAVIINQVVIGQPEDYRLYQPDGTEYKLQSTALPGGKMMSMLPQQGFWNAGQHIIDAPSGGMFDNSRIYYTFVVEK